MKTQAPAFLCNLATELLAMYAIEEIPLVTVLSRILLALRQVDEKGLAYAQTYHAATRDKVKETILLGKEMVIAEYLAGPENEEVRESLKHTFKGAPFEDALAAEATGRYRGGKGTVPGPVVVDGAVPKAQGDARAPPIAKASGGGSADPKARQAAMDVRASTVAKQICFMSDVRAGKSCSGAAAGTCPRVHLDTSKAGEARDFYVAKAAFDQKAPRRFRGAKKSSGA